MSAVVKELPTRRELDRTTIGIMRDILRRTRMDLAQARLYARGNPQGIATIDTAGQAVRTALDVFENAYIRGKL